MKSSLIDSLKLDVKPADIKLLIKGKVIQDLTLVSGLDNHAFMCMISPGKTETPEADLDMDIDQVVKISAQAWAQIERIVVEDVGERGRELVNKMKLLESGKS